MTLLSAPPRGNPVTLKPPPTPQPLVIEIAGNVKNPGVYELPRGSRVIDAIDAAGGPTADADLNTINQAKVVEDGTQILVGSLQIPTASNQPTSDSGSASKTDSPAAAQSKLININTASISQLDILPGIGPAIAQRIIDYREKHGPFQKIADIINVSGIGPSTFDKIKALIEVGP